MQEILILSCLSVIMRLSASPLSHANVIRIKRPIHAKLGVINKYLNHEQSLHISNLLHRFTKVVILADWSYFYVKYKQDDLVLLSFTSQFNSYLHSYDNQCESHSVPFC